MPAVSSKSAKPLQGVRILSLSLNIPGPVALIRLRQLGAKCLKFEPPGSTATLFQTSADPLNVYSPATYKLLHAGIRVAEVDLKTAKGQARLQRALKTTDVLMTSFRPGAMLKLGLNWKNLHATHPHLSQVAIVGAPGSRADEPGHDLTYVAENNLLTGLELPATLYADMAGSLMTTEAVLQAVLMQRQQGTGRYFEVALSEAAAHLALPHAWGLTLPGTMLGGGHAGYAIYPCQDGRVAMAALEPHFAKRLCVAAGLKWSNAAMMTQANTRQAIADFIAPLSRKALDQLALAHDIPLHTLS